MGPKPLRSMIKAVDNYVQYLKRIAEKGRVKIDDISPDFVQLVKLVNDGMENAVYGNHLSSSVATSMIFSKRFSAGESYEGNVIPLMYMQAFRVVAKDFEKRCIEKTSSSSLHRPDVFNSVVGLVQNSSANMTDTLAELAFYGY